MIVLRESIVSVTSAVGSRTWSLLPTLAAVGGFGIASCLWWLYFNFLETAVVMRGIRLVHTFNDGQMPIVMGLALIAVGTEQTIAQARRARCFVCGCAVGIIRRCRLVHDGDCFNFRCGVSASILVADGSYDCTCNRISNLGTKTITACIKRVALSVANCESKHPSVNQQPSSRPNRCNRVWRHSGKATLRTRYRNESNKRQPVRLQEFAIVSIAGCLYFRNMGFCPLTKLT